MSFWMERSEMKNLLPRDVTLTVIYHSERFCLEEPKRAYCEISHIRSRWQTMSFWRPQGGRISTQAVANISIKVNMKKGIPRRAYTLARNDITVILNGTQWSEESPSNGIRKFLAFARNDNHLGFLTFGLSASVNFIFSFRASAVPEQACSAQHSAWRRFGMT